MVPEYPKIMYYILIEAYFIYSIILVSSVPHSDSIYL